MKDAGMPMPTASTSLPMTSTDKKMHTDNAGLPFFGGGGWEGNVGRGIGELLQLR
jgi:hypothetical protein